MADIFNFYVYDDRSIRFELAEPIMLEDKDVTQFRFRIPKSLNGFDMSDWEWWFIFVNPNGTKYTTLLELTDDEDEPEEYSIATYTLGYEFTDTIGTVRFALEALNMQDNEIVNEWHTRTYSTVVTDTLQGESSVSSRFRITYNLAENIVSSNTKTRIADGESYATTISSTNADYQINTIAVTMGGTDITATAVSGNEISIPSVTGDVSIVVTALFYPQVETDASTLMIGSEGTGTLRVKLHAQPTQSQTVTLHSDALTLSESSLTFTTSNWDTWQSVTVTAPSVETTEYAYINLTNSDPMMTETTVMVTVKELGYEDYVDTTIPTVDMHTVTTADFTSTSVYGDYIRLFGYNAEYENIKIPSTLNGKTTWITCTSTLPSASSSAFSGNTTIKYVTFEDGVIYRGVGVTSGCSAEGLFYGCTSLIGVSNMNPAVTSLSSAFRGCTSLKFIDNLDELVNVTTIKQMFYNTGIEYVQDLSALESVSDANAAFRDSSLLKKIFGMPSVSGSALHMYNNCTSLKYAIIPIGVTNCEYTCFNNTSLKRCDILDDTLTTSIIKSTTFMQTSNGLEVYCTANSTTYNTMASLYGSSSTLTIKTFGGSAVPSIVVWGDSMSSPNKNWIEWPARLQTKLGTANYLVKNEALAGEWSTSTIARQGGYTMTTNAFTIPADTASAEITITVDGTEQFGANQPDVSGNAGIFSAGASFNPCAINAVKGTISRSDSQYFFTRLESGTAVSVSNGSEIISEKDTVFNASENIMLIYLNGNAGWHKNPSRLLDMFQKAVAHFEECGGTKYIVAGPIGVSSDLLPYIIEFEPLAEEEFGAHWINLRQYLIENGLSQNNLTASELDVERMAQGLAPSSLIGGAGYPYDGTGMYDGEVNKDGHPNVYGSNTIMLAFYEKGVALGYWT